MYDEDYNLISSTPGQTGTTEKYRLDEFTMDAVPCSQLERLMFVLSSTPHQAFLLLHLHLQGKKSYFNFILNICNFLINILGLTFNSCPLMSLSSASNDATEKLWPIKQLRQDKRCEICFSFDLNPWLTCIRKTALCNLHPGFISRPRQMFLLVLQITKYLPIPVSYNGPYFQFLGPLQKSAEPTNSRLNFYTPQSYKNPGVRIEKDTTVDATLPRTIQQAPVVAYGK